MATSPIIKSLCPTAARAATTCTKCGAAHSSLGGYIIETGEALGTKVRSITPIAHSSQDPTYSHCLKCARGYQARLQRRDRKAQVNARVRRNPENLNTNDCAIVATCEAFRMTYASASKLFKQHGYKADKQALNSYQLQQVWQDLAAEKGKRIVTLVDDPGSIGARRVTRSVGQVASQVRKGERGIILAKDTGRMAAHAMAVSKGTAHNLQRYARHGQVFYAMKVVAG